MKRHIILLFLFLVFFNSLLSSQEINNLRILFQGQDFDDYIGYDNSFPILPVDEDGWTDFIQIIEKGYENSRIIFISNSSGDDNTGENYGISDVIFDSNGMFQPVSSVKAYKSIAAGYNQLRDGYCDILLLQRGNEWYEGFSSDSIGNWSKSGVSSENRMIVASYGIGARPTLLIGSGAGITTYTADNLIFAGIRIFSHTWATETPDRAVDANGGDIRNHLYEDCVFERNGNRVQGFTNIEFRRNTFIEGVTGSLTAKVYAHVGTGLFFDENIFYSPELKNRHFYIDPDEYGSDGNDYTIQGVFIRKNIFYTSMRTGLSIRSGGTMNNNLFLRNDLVLIGGHGGSEGSIQSAIIANNVFMESIEPDFGDGEWGLYIKNNDGTQINNNIWVDPSGLSDYTYAIFLSGGDTIGVARNIDISNNIVHGWAASGNEHFALSINSNLMDVQNVTIQDNDFQMVNGGRSIIIHRAYANGTKKYEGFTYRNNNYYASTSESNWFFPDMELEDWISQSGETGAVSIHIPYSDPERNLKTYNLSIGNSYSTEDFMLRAIEQSRYNWNPEYSAPAVNDYIRIGFDKSKFE